MKTEGIIIRITKIEVNGKNNRVYSLYSDDIFLFEITEDTLVHFGISKDKSYRDGDLEKILNHDLVTRGLQQAYRYLSRRPHLQSELRRKLLQKSYTKPVIEKVLKILMDKNYINDDEFIRLFFKDEVNNKKSGPLLIKKKLIEKGASAADVDEIVNHLYTDELEFENALAVMEKKSAKYSDPDHQKVKQKTIRFLQQKGFTWQAIGHALQHLPLPDSTDEQDGC
ncbi:MAG: RecX family transcriptional regulator [Calditrichaceae bacterium]